MKLILPVPTRKVVVSPGTFTFEIENRLVDVLAVSRSQAGPGRWHYTAHFNHHDTHPEYPRIGIDGSLTSWIRRASHPSWKPPAFPDNKAGTVRIAKQQAAKDPDHG